MTTIFGQTNLDDRLDALHERVNALRLTSSDKVGFSYHSVISSTWEGVAGTRSGQGLYQTRRTSAKL